MATVAEPSAAGAFVPAPFRVTDRRQDTADTWTLALEPMGSGFAVAPGQFVMVYAFGVGEVPISVSGPPEQPGQPVVLTVRDVGAVTHAICASEPGAVLGLRGPLGNSWPVEAAKDGDVIVVAGGIGLAPLRPAVRHVLARRAGYGAVSVLYGARTPSDLTTWTRSTRGARS
jgi:NAD(P)H-flavin reductase